ncbi:MAG: LysE family transporter [Saprospiraceae bacterium]
MDIYSSLVLFGEGCLTGFTLTIMLGPVTMIILKYGIQVNRVAGLWAAIGTWVSDLFFIVATFLLTASLAEWSERPSVRFWMYVISGIGLLVMGLLMLRIKGKKVLTGSTPKQTGYIRAFFGGFVVNTLSPVTLFFWLGVAIFLHMETGSPFLYYGGIMLSLALGDFLKAWLAPRLIAGIKGKYVYWVQIIVGVLIVLAGLYMVGYGFFS